MRYTLHIHLYGERPHKEQLFLGGDLKVEKFALPVVKLGVR